MTIKINADTSTGLELESDTSGIIDIQSGGTTKMTIGTTIDVQGNELVLDADADTSIHADTDDQIDFKVGGSDVAKIDSNGNFSHNGIEVDMFRLTADKPASENDTDISANLERCDDASFSKIGTGMSQSSGVFTFPRTGVYEVKVSAMIESTGSDTSSILQTQVTLNNSSYDVVAWCLGGDDAGNHEDTGTFSSQCFVNVTDTSNVKVKFNITSFGNSSKVHGDSNINKTCFSFIRLGDSQ